MSGRWQQRVHPPSGTPPLSQVQAAVHNLADRAGLPHGKVRVVFQTVADVALLGTVLISGTLAAIHLYRTLFPKRKEGSHAPEPANGDGTPPRRRFPPTAMAFADGQDGHESKARRGR